MEHRLFGSVRIDLREDLCFVLMPFEEAFSEVWEDVIRPTAQDLNLKASRADDIMRPGVIMRDVWENILRARVLIADLTGRNPNVFYELGLAHAVEKDVILLAQRIEDLPFDQRHLRVIQYSTTGRGLESLRDALRASLAAVLERPVQELAPGLRREAATATRRELQAEHELAPYLTFTFRSAYANGQPVNPQVELENVGQEMALDCLYCARVVWERHDMSVPPRGIPEQLAKEYRFPAESAFTSPFRMAPGKAQVVGLYEISGFDHAVSTVLRGVPYRVGLVEAMVCQTPSGTRYRFRSDQLQRDEWGPGDPFQGWELWIPPPSLP